jgi:diguanylate cyclase (GGDEF)-like protein
MDSADIKKSGVADIAEEPSRGEVSDRRHRPAMAVRMAIGFAGLALVVLAANLITRHATRDARERMHQLVLEHEPLARATESLASAIAGHERAVVEQAESALPSERAVEPATQQMMLAFAAYAETAQVSSAYGDSTRALTRDIEDYSALGRELVSYSAARAGRIREYWRAFAELEQLLRAPQDDAVRIAGAVFANEALLDVSQALARVREQVGAPMSQAGDTALRAAVAREAAFRTTLKARRAQLIQSLGAAWYADVDRRFTALMATRRAIFDADFEVVRRSVAFRDKNAEISGKVRTQLVEPSRQTLVDAEKLAAQAVDKADRQLVSVSAAVLFLTLIISVATVMSIASPLKRLTEATRRLANGEVRTRVPRGGLLELDTLALAFNQMARQLEKAEQEVRTHRVGLEAKVDERTRELRYLADHDPLTQLPNRRQLFAYIEQSIERARHTGRRVALLFIDLDNFKTINDSLGHAFGDRVLQAVSERLRSSRSFRKAFSARFGGDEFTIVFEDLESLDAVERLCGAVLEEFQRPLPVQGRALRISVSVGAGVYPDHARDTQVLLRAADAALFRSKERGRSCSSMFAPELLATASARFQLEQSLRRAVERGELELKYQPEACFESLGVQTFEALLRWRRPDGDVVMPAEFLPVAEQSGLIADISDWSLRTAIEAAAHWHRGPWPGARVAVNISSQQLMSGNFGQRLESLLAEYSLPASCLEIELTENVLQTGARTIAALQQLREIGVSIALDDFGTGYSSLTSLERLPLTRVKIDRSLVASLDTSSRSPAIVRAIIGLCHSLGLQVTAEGVERTSQLAALLTDRGVQVQGYLVARPLTEAAVPEFLSGARSRLEELLLAVPVPQQDIDTTGTRFIRTLRNRARGA